MQQNKIKGIRACSNVMTLVSHEWQKKIINRIFLTLGERVICKGLAIEICEDMVHAEFSQESRHIVRLQKK